MRCKKLFIHIGTHKTGSTTIQSILTNSRDHLLDEGIVYLNNFFDLSSEIRTVNQPDFTLEKKFRGELLKELEKVNGNNWHTCVISNEKFSGDKMIGYRNAGFVAKILKNAFEPLHFDIKIVAYIRRQDLFMESTYTQRIFSGGSFTFSDFMDQFNESDFHWDTLLDSYADVFGKENILVHVFNKNKERKKNELINNFGEMIGSRFLKNYSKETVRNRGYSRDTLEIARLTNKFLPKREMRKLRDLLRKADPQTKNYPYFTREEQKAFLDIYESSNRRVAHTYLNRADDDLFTPPDYSTNDPKQLYEGLTPDAVAVVMSKAMLIMDSQLTERLGKMEREINRSLSERMSRKFKSVIRKFRTP